MVAWAGAPARSMEKRVRASLAVTSDDVESTLQAIAGLVEGDASPGTAPTVVMDSYALSLLDDDRATTTLRAAADALGDAGRIGIVELCLRPDVIDDEETAALQTTASQVFDQPLFPRTPSVWWAMLETAGFEVVHRLDSDIRLPRNRARRRIGRKVSDRLGVVGLAAIPAPQSS